MTHTFDVLTLLVMAVLAIIGYTRGFLEELGRFLGLVISSLVAIRFFAPVSSWLQSRTSLDDALLAVVSFLAIFLPVLVLFRLLSGTLQLFMLSRGIRSSNRVLGFMFGILKGAFALMIIMLVMDMAPNPEFFQNLRERSITYRYLTQGRRWVVGAFGMEEQVAKGRTWMKESVGSFKGTED
ncbi:MAG: CvpA family protein [Candidatus Neomarinimicrobiota bacterium]